jgi:hypothetical protein
VNYGDNNINTVRKDESAASHLKPLEICAWNVCVGMVIVEEGDGLVSNFDGMTSDNF